MSGAMSGGFDKVLSCVTYNAGLTTEYAGLAGPGPDCPFSTVGQSGDSNESKNNNIIGYPLNHNLHIIEALAHNPNLFAKKFITLKSFITQNDSENYNYTEIMNNMKRN
jgi:hypothetical protein